MFVVELGCCSLNSWRSVSINGTCKWFDWTSLHLAYAKFMNLLCKSHISGFNSDGSLTSLSSDISIGHWMQRASRSGVRLWHSFKNRFVWSQVFLFRLVCGFSHPHWEVDPACLNLSENELFWSVFWFSASARVAARVVKRLMGFEQKKQENSQH